MLRLFANLFNILKISSIDFVNINLEYSLFSIDNLANSKNLLHFVSK